MQSPLTVLVYGGGGQYGPTKIVNVVADLAPAVGSVLGWRIAQHSQSRVSVVCRSNYDKVRQTGFSMQTSAWGAGPFVPHRVFQSKDFLRRPSATHYDYVICANKFTHDNRSIIQDLGSAIGPQTTLVAAQNGMDVEVPLKHAFPYNTILSAICQIGCEQSTPGHIRQVAGISPSAFVIGVYGRSRQGRDTDHRRRDALVALDSRFSSVDDIVMTRWRKLIFNATWNATAALTNMNTHEILGHSFALDLATQLAREACSVARRAGIELGDGYADAVIGLARSSGAITPSTLQDARNRRPMEIASIWGKVSWFTWVTQLLDANNARQPTLFRKVQHMVSTCRLPRWCTKFSST